MLFYKHSLFDIDSVFRYNNSVCCIYAPPFGKGAIFGLVREKLPNTLSARRADRGLICF